MTARAHHFLAGGLEQNLSRHADAQGLSHVTQANAATSRLVAQSPDEDHGDAGIEEPGPEGSAAGTHSAGDAELRDAAKLKDKQE